MKQPWEILSAISDFEKKRNKIYIDIQLWRQKDAELCEKATQELEKPEGKRNYTIINEFGNAYHSAIDSLISDLTETEAKIKALKWVLELS